MTKKDPLPSLHDGLDSDGEDSKERISRGPMSHEVSFISCIIGRVNVEVGGVSGNGVGPGLGELGVIVLISVEVIWLVLRGFESERKRLFFDSYVF